MVPLIILLIFITHYAITVDTENAPLTNNPWDLNGPCQEYVEKLALAQSAMVKCATNWSIPPKVCTNCFDKFIEFKQVEFDTKHLNTRSLYNRTCAQVIYNDYLLSYGYDISDSLSSIWEKSRCESCLHISWNLTHKSSEVEYLNRTSEFANRLMFWRSCVSNYTDGQYSDENSSICSVCEKETEDLYNYYWEIYVTPNVDFCVDVETTMNDTLHLWNDVWRCADRKDRKRDAKLIIASATAMTVLTLFFYTASFIQGGGARRQLIQYSRLDAPRGNRSRLLSSSITDHGLFLPSEPSGSLNPL